MGYMSPSHFVPLASPGIISQGLKWMLNSTSPFYIKPRFDLDLLQWGYHFWKSSTASQFHLVALGQCCGGQKRARDDYSEPYAT